MPMSGTITAAGTVKTDRPSSTYAAYQTFAVAGTWNGATVKLVGRYYIGEGPTDYFDLDIPDGSLTANGVVQVATGSDELLIVTTGTPNVKWALR